MTEGAEEEMEKQTNKAEVCGNPLRVERKHPGSPRVYTRCTLELLGKVATKCRRGTSPGQQSTYKIVLPSVTIGGHEGSKSMQKSRLKLNIRKETKSLRKRSPWQGANRATEVQKVNEWARYARAAMPHAVPARRSPVY